MAARFQTYWQKFRRNFDRWSVVALLLTLFIIVPTVFLLLQLIDGPGESWGHFVENLLPKYLQNSLYLAVVCSVLTLLLGVSSAWFSTRYDFPLRRSLEWLLILPLAIPSYITAYAYAGVFDYGGPVESLLQGLSPEAAKVDIMNIHGLAMVLSVSLYPYVYVACRAFFLHQSQSLIEASQVLGQNQVRSFFRLILPLARPAIVGGVILVLMEVLNDYGAAKYFGVNTFTTGIFKSWFGYEEFNTATYLAALLLVIIFSLILIEQRQRRRKRFVVDGKGGKRLARIRLRGTRGFLVTAVVGLPVVLGFLIPVAQLLYWAVQVYSQVAWGEYFSVAGQSLAIAGMAAALCVILATALLLAGHWNRLRWIGWLTKLGVLGYAIPGAVIAIGVYIPGLVIDKWLIRTAEATFSTKIGLVLTGTVIALIYAYIVRFLAVAFNPISAGKQKVQNSLLEASQSLGKGPWATFFRIELPLLQPALLGAFILVFIDVMKELPLTLILKPYNVQTLAIEAYQYASDERIMEAAFPSLTIVAVGVLPVIFLNRLIRQD
ncbi:MAG: iron ABC transporter permease [Bacteroidota bacterium]